MKLITQWTEIPKFDNEDDEAVFWADARIEPRLMNQSLLKADNRDSTTITLRFDPRMLATSSASPVRDT